MSWMTAAVSEAAVDAEAFTDFGICTYESQEDI